MEIMEKRIDPTIAVPNPSIVNPVTSELASKNKNALMTKINNPSDRIVIGKVNITNTGLISRFTNEITATARRAAGKLATCIPGKIFDTIIRANPCKSQLAISFTISILYTSIQFYR